MIAYKFCILPEQQSIDYLQNLFKDCPYDVDWDRLHIELNLTLDKTIENVVDSNITYQALPVNPNPSATNKGLVQIFEPSIEVTNLYLPVTSPDLYNLAYALRSKFKPLFHPHPFLYLCIKTGYHSCIHYNTYTNAVSDYLVNYQDPLYFKLQTVVPMDIDVNYDQMLYEFNGLE